MDNFKKTLAYLKNKCKLFVFACITSNQVYLLLSAKMNSTNNFTLRNIKRPLKLSQQVETQLREAIDKKVFSEGENLPSENELCKIFGVSRNVIREALLVLSAKGLIHISKGKCAIVREPTITNVLDSFSQLVNYKCGNKGLDYILVVRKMIEPEVASQSARNRSEKDIEELQRNLQLMRENKNDMVQISYWDIQFHNTIAKSCDNPLIPIVLEPIFHVLSKFHPPIFYNEGVVQITLTYHEKVLKAIVNQNSDAAFDAMKEHLNMAEKHNLRLFSATE